MQLKWNHGLNMLNLYHLKWTYCSLKRGLQSSQIAVPILPFSYEMFWDFRWEVKTQYKVFSWSVRQMPSLKSSDSQGFVRDLLSTDPAYKQILPTKPLVLQQRTKILLDQKSCTLHKIRKQLFQVRGWKIHVIRHCNCCDIDQYKQWYQHYFGLLSV